MKKKTTSVIICEACTGYGTITKSEMIDYHQGLSEDVTETCVDCGGTGRFLQTITLTPLINPKTRLEVLLEQTPNSPLVNL